MKHNTETSPAISFDKTITRMTHYLIKIDIVHSQNQSLTHTLTSPILRPKLNNLYRLKMFTRQEWNHPILTIHSLIKVNARFVNIHKYWDIAFASEGNYLKAEIGKKRTKKIVRKSKQNLSKQTIVHQQSMSVLIVLIQYNFSMTEYEGENTVG